MGITLYGLVENGISYKSNQIKTSPDANTKFMNSYLPKSNLSSSIEDSFLNWYYKSHTNHSSYQTLSHGGNSLKSLFSEFLMSNQNAQVQLKQLTQNEKSHFKLIDRNVAINLSRQIQYNQGSNTSYHVKGKGIAAIASHISPATLPGNFPKSTGEYVMVTVNYFSISWWYPGPWYAPWQGYWGQLNYGEQDNYNILWFGSLAQTNYNNLEFYFTIGGLLGGAAVSGIAGYLTAGAIGGSWGGPIGVIAGAIVGVAIGLTLYQITNAITITYESTYANEPSGQKYMWIYMQNDYYYPWITVVGTFASSIGWYGHLSNGNSCTIWPNIAWGAYGGLTGVTISAYFSSYTNYITNNYGQNVWISA
ncbi:MAG: hypothetical protein ACYCUZ_06675 [Cuniculiplasma sp.]